MGYQALLFSPDEKLARVVCQVFSEVDFTVEPAHEPFGAVKRLMAQHYDAIVVDCENEQNASLLFKSARNSSFNQSALAIALVEGQAGVAKAYRIGANLVLTKPINVEQAKGTLRVARGLLRKNSDAAAVSATSGTVPALPPPPAPAVSSFSPTSHGAAEIAPPPTHPELPGVGLPEPATIPATFPRAFPASLSAGLPASVSTKVQDGPALQSPPGQIRITMADEPAVPARQLAPLTIIRNDAARNNNDATNSAAPAVTAQSIGSALASPGSAAAPAPARKITPPPATPPAKESKTVESGSAYPSSDLASDPASSRGSAPGAEVPSFAIFTQEEDSGGPGVLRKMLFVAVVLLALTALGYLGFGKLGQSSTPAPAPQPVNAPQDSGKQNLGKQDSGQPAPTLAPTSSPVEGPSPGTPNRASSATQTAVPKAARAESRAVPTPGAENPPAITIALNAGSSDGGSETKAETRKADSAPILVKPNPVGVRTQAPSQDPAPPLPSPLTVAAAEVATNSDSNDSAFRGLLSSASLPKPTLATARVSQGVSQGLLIKRVQPNYPRAALAVHAHGAVQIEATIDKEGNVTNPKVLSGDPLLAHAALEAVRQWRYKPYYLDGEPVEIQTEITVNFKAD